MGRQGRPPDGVSHGSGDEKRLGRRVVAPRTWQRTLNDETTVVERLHVFLAGEATEHCRPLLEAAYARAARIAIAGGGNTASDTIAAQVYAADVIALLAAEGELDAADTETIVGALAETCSLPLLAASLDVFIRAAASPALQELPPVVAAEIQLRLLVYMDVVADVSLWRRTTAGDVECIVPIGVDPTRPRPSCRSPTSDHGAVQNQARTTHAIHDGARLSPRQPNRCSRCSTQGE